MTLAGDLLSLCKQLLKIEMAEPRVHLVVNIEFDRDIRDNFFNRLFNARSVIRFMHESVHSQAVFRHALFDRRYIEI